MDAWNVESRDISLVNAQIKNLVLVSNVDKKDTCHLLALAKVLKNQKRNQKFKLNHNVAQYKTSFKLYQDKLMDAWNVDNKVTLLVNVKIQMLELASNVEILDIWHPIALIKLDKETKAQTKMLTEIEVI